MIIRHVSNTANIRVLKQAIALQDAGHMVQIRAREVSQLHLALWRRCVNAQNYAPDITHIHCGANDQAFVAEAIAKTPGPYVVDVHDYPERYEHPGCPLIVPSQGYRDHYSGRAVVVYNKVPASLWPRQELRGRSDKWNVTALVSALRTDESIRDYRDIHDMLNGNLHVFSANFDCDLLQRMFVWYPRRYETMLNSLTHYQTGWAGAANHRETAHAIVTHKYWEYVAAGVVPITWKSDEMSALPWGVPFQPVAPRPDRDVCFPLDNDNGDERTMDFEVPKLLDAYSNAKI